ncbi:MAG TPA: hypothetical protein VKV77_04870 [Methylovirgula sp.]|nr:hypothetical protein [Methylovirgula sp.]
MWDAIIWAAWIISAVLFLWMFVDFLGVNKKYDEGVLLSSREGVDDLFGTGNNGSRGK